MCLNKRLKPRRIAGDLICHDAQVMHVGFTIDWSLGFVQTRVAYSPIRQWHGALMYYLILICVWINGWVNNREAGDLRRYRAHYDVTVMGSLDKRLRISSEIG